MIIRIHHHTVHTYDLPVSFGDHQLRLRPRDTHLLKVNNFHVETSPPGRQRWVRDVFSNIVLVVNFGLQTADKLVFDCRLELETGEENPFDFVLEPYATGFPFTYTDYEQTVLAPSIHTSVPGSETVMDWFSSRWPGPPRHDDVVAFLAVINLGIRQAIRYERREEEGVRTPDETLALGSGSCRDMAVLLMALCRRLGLASRFVSGYLHIPEPSSGDYGAQEGNRAAGSMHAWTEVYLPGAGWKGFDPTNGIVANHAFAPSAVGIEPAAVDPINGVFYADEPVRSRMDVTLTMEEGIRSS